MKPPIFSFDPTKALNTVLYIASRVTDPTLHRISKIMYFADKDHLAKYGRLICGDSYVAMKHGPVPSGVYDMLKSVRGDGVSMYKDDASKTFVVEGKTVVPLRKADEEVFSDSDLECLDRTIAKYGNLTFGELTELSHDKAWDAVDENDEIDIELIIASLADSETLLDHLGISPHQPT